MVVPDCCFSLVVFCLAENSVIEYHHGLGSTIALAAFSGILFAKPMGCVPARTKGPERTPKSTMPRVEGATDVQSATDNP